MDVVRTVSSAADTSTGSPSPNNEARSFDDSAVLDNNNAPNTNEESSDRVVIAPEESASATVENDAENGEGGPMPIPPEPTAVQGDDDEEDNSEEMEEDDEDDYEYEYEDEDDAAFGGFLQVDHASAAAAPAAPETSASAEQRAPNKIEEDDQQPPAVEEAQPEEPAKKAQWREPSREAVNMSLRAEKETSGSKRRLAQDLYRIMNKDTEETGFSLKPSSEDSMDKWTIKLFQFDNDSNLAKDMLVLGLDAIELEMSFPDQYPFEPPFVRVVKPRFKRQTGFVMNGAICMELLTKEGWNPVNDIESVIVSVRSLLVVGEGRLEAAYNLTETKYKSLLETAQAVKKAATTESSADDEEEEDGNPDQKRQRKNSAGEAISVQRQRDELSEQQRRLLRSEKSSTYSEADAKAAYEHLSSYHKKKGWDTSGWWARKG
mmetsp:Transcript_20839/g.45162  ORF Transcript_20839/g.45162 Transcript_20839/m.45162 type:complete len:433 (+) Transcript_20839:153-1451(+)|eukprot:CAMPEP_0168752274 /NCGR_PEP_ID=MMETSP0724-20121128/18298_1 /TAXON_ID=265536 /ORGANISM="Amphiprora sp., Strain CCMP467" /LENGTH=432 /DNA_ID=CAMNT_0008800511 /DNA_START=103 /DNA_END=1401 /DNA_ORIENTATION=+